MFPLAKYHEFDPIFYILEFKDVFFLLNGVIYEHIFLLAKRSTRKSEITCTWNRSVQNRIWIVIVLSSKKMPNKY